MQLVSAVGAKRSLAERAEHRYIRTKPGSIRPRRAMRKIWRTLPPPDFDGLPLHKYFVPTKILPYLATRGCYWGRCEFCDHGEGYTAGYRSKKIQDVLAEITHLRDKYGARHFHFTDESYPPALFRKLARGLVESQDGHHLDDAHAVREEPAGRCRLAGCEGLRLPYLHFGYESGIERVLQLMDKATTTEVMTKHLKLTADAGIWNHCMGFFGFPGETKEEAWQSVQFLGTEQGLCAFAGVRHVRSGPA